MTIYCLEMRSTADWRDVRYREYTSSIRKAAKFQNVPKIKFIDHQIVPIVMERKGKRLPKIFTLSNHVRIAMR